MFRKKKIKCRVCKKKTEFTEILSMYYQYSPYLDMRRIEDPLDEAIQRCPHCGYCSQRIDARIKNAKEIVRSDIYQKQLNNSEYPKLANSFLCCAHIEEITGDYSVAGLNSLRAAWACDCDNLDELAKKCRKKAIELFAKAKEKRQTFAEKTEVEGIVIVDLLRRTGQFEKALKLCEEGLKDNMILRVLEFQKNLIGRSDIASHSIAEALKPED